MSSADEKIAKLEARIEYLEQRILFWREECHKAESIVSAVFDAVTDEWGDYAL